LLFGPQTTPDGYESAPDSKGVFGILLEEKVIGGLVGVLWKTGEVSNMEKIVGLVLDYRGTERTLSA